MSLYTLVFVNESTTAGTACLYQTAPPGLQSLAWLVRPVAAGATTSFGWDLTYGYMFTENASGGAFSEVVPADPVTANQVTFGIGSSGYAFGTPTAGTPAGTLTITESSNVMVGFALAGAPLFGATPAPVTLTFPTVAAPAYQLAFGSFTAGQVMPAPGTSPAPIPVTYPSGVFAMTATLSSANVLTVVPSS